MHQLQVKGGVSSVSVGWMLSPASCCVTLSSAADQHAFMKFLPVPSSMTILPVDKADGFLLLFLYLTIWKVDTVNLFPNGGIEETYPFLL